MNPTETLSPLAELRAGINADLDELRAEIDRSFTELREALIDYLAGRE